MEIDIQYFSESYPFVYVSTDVHLLDNCAPSSRMRLVFQLRGAVVTQQLLCSLMQLQAFSLQVVNETVLIHVQC